MSKPKTIFESAKEVLENVPVHESMGGYIESMDISDELDTIVKNWKKWKAGPMTEAGDIKDAKADLLDYFKRNLK